MQTTYFISFCLFFISMWFCNVFHFAFSHTRSDFECLELELETLETCQAGDVLVVDNALVLHGRLSYQGCRYMATGLTHD